MKFNNIHINRAPLSDNEIQSAMNFEALFDTTGSAMSHTAKAKGIVKWIGLSVILLAGTAALIWNTTLNSEASSTESSKETPIALEDSLDTKEQIAQIQPPIKGIDLPFESIAVDNAKGGTFQIASSALTIPPNTFSDAEGNAIDGEITLHYREFNSALEIFTAGIPMTLDSAGVEYHFESNGMVELRGEQNGEEVFIMPEKQIEIAMDVEEKRDGFNEYFFNETTGEWEYIRPQRYEVKKVKIPEQGTDNMVSSEFFDEEVDDFAITEIPEQNSVQNDPVLQRIKTQLTQTEPPLEPKAAEGDLPLLELEVDKTEFPELAGFLGLQFQVSEKDSKKFDTGWGDIIWEDIRVSKSEKEGYYRMIFSKPGKRVRVSCTPVFQGEALENAKEKYEEMLSQYNTRVDSLKVAEEERRLALLEQQRQWREQQRMNAEERARQQREQMQNMQIAQNLNGNITLLFTANSFGLYNCDTPRNLPDEKVLVADFQDEDQNDISSMVKLIEGDKRMLYHYYNNYKNFGFDPGEKNMLLSTSTDGKLLYLTPNEFEEQVNEDSPRRCKIRMNKCEEELETFEELEDFLEEKGMEISS